MKGTCLSSIACWICLTGTRSSLMALLHWMRPQRTEPDGGAEPVGGVASIGVTLADRARPAGAFGGDLRARGARGTTAKIPWAHEAHPPLPSIRPEALRARLTETSMICTNLRFLFASTLALSLTSACTPDRVP